MILGGFHLMNASVKNWGQIFTQKPVLQGQVWLGQTKGHGKYWSNQIQLELCWLERRPKMSSSAVAIHIIDIGNWVGRIVLSLFERPAISSLGKNM